MNLTFNSDIDQLTRILSLVGTPSDELMLEIQSNDVSYLFTLVLLVICCSNTVVLSIICCSNAVVISVICCSSNAVVFPVICCKNTVVLLVIYSIVYSSRIKSEVSEHGWKQTRFKFTWSDD